MSLQAAMLLDSEPPDSQPMARRAALTLHALGAADRAWLLAQLPAAQREHLQPMLEELEALGIPASRSLLQGIVEASTVAPGTGVGIQQAAKDEAPAPPGSVQFHQQQAALSRLYPAAIVRILQAEPVGLIAQLLHSHAWPWRQAVLEELGLVKRRRVEEFLDGLRRQVRSKAPDALHASLVAAVYSRAMAFAEVQEPGLQVARPAALAAAGRRGRFLSGWFKRRPKGQQ